MNDDSQTHPSGPEAGPTRADPSSASTASAARPNALELLSLLESRRSVRRFAEREIAAEQVERLLRAATSAPSATNRQPWRFTVVRSASMRGRIADAVAARVAALQKIVERGHHREDLGDYWQHFHQPLHSARLLVVPQFREYPDLVVRFLESGGASGAELETARVTNTECCATSAAVMALLLQAHAEGLGACWMSGPLVARAEIRALLGVRPPWQLLGLVAIGYPAEEPPSPGRRPLAAVVDFVEEAPADH
jgi:nitroreductase